MLYIEYIRVHAYSEVQFSLLTSLCMYSLQSIPYTLSLSGKMLSFQFTRSRVVRRKRFRANQLGFKALDLGSRAS